ATTLVIEVVCDEQEGASRGHRVQQLGDDAVCVLGEERDVVHRDEIVGAGRWRVLRDVAFDPSDGVGKWRVGGCSALECGGGDVDGGDRPPVLGEPDRVRAFTASDIKGASGGKGRSFGDECG